MSRRLRLILAVALALVVIAAATRSVWLNWAGQALVNDQPPVKADAALVLGGDYSGYRIRHAAQLAAQGYVPRVLVSGAVKLYGKNEADLAIDYAVALGLPRDLFEPVYMKAVSTREECAQLQDQLQRRGVRRLLMVTSNFHTARASRICRSALGGIEVRTIAAPDRDFTTSGWWHTREGQKTFFFELSKTVANWIGH